MAKPEWGTKRICQSCGTRYYDMRREPPVCPSCETVFAPRGSNRQRRGSPAPVVEAASVAAVKKKKSEPAVAKDENLEGFEDETVDDEEEVDGIESDDDDDALMEDASELGEDDDDVSEVMEHLDDEDLGDRG